MGVELSPSLVETDQHHTLLSPKVRLAHTHPEKDLISSDCEVKQSEYLYHDLEVCVCVCTGMCAALYLVHVMDECFRTTYVYCRCMLIYTAGGGSTQVASNHSFIRIPRLRGGDLSGL